MAKRNSPNEDKTPTATPETALEIFIKDVYFGRKTIYNPDTGEPYSFDTITEARDLIYTGHYYERD